MLKLVDDLCVALSQAGDSSQESLLRATFCFENFRGFPDDAWPEDIKSINIELEDFIRLKKSVVRYINNQPNSPLVGSAIWAFSKAADENDKEYLISLLAKYLDHDGQTLYQIMCALGNIGEVLFESGGSSILDVEDNRASARKYLVKESRGQSP